MQETDVSRPEAIRRLVELGLKVKDILETANDAR
jgi:hypothetical protein